MYEKADKECVSIDTFVQIDHLIEDITVFQSRIPIHVQVGLFHCFHVDKPFIQWSYVCR